MKAAEILRKLADMIDQQGDDAQVDRPENSVAHAELAPVEVDNTDNTETTVMVAPLQAKIELLKKATGVDSHYDEETPCDSAEDAELALMKQRAGIPQVVVQELSDDEPLDY
jgi:hypothetical protein